MVNSCLNIDLNTYAEVSLLSLYGKEVWIPNYLMLWRIFIYYFSCDMPKPN